MKAVPWTAGDNVPEGYVVTSSLSSQDRFLVKIYQQENEAYGDASKADAPLRAKLADLIRDTNNAKSIGLEQDISMDWGGAPIKTTIITIETYLDSDDVEGMTL